MSTELFSVAGRVALVSGGSSGIGRHQAITLAAAGAKTVLLGRRDAQLREIRDRIEADGGRAGFVAADLSDKARMADIATAVRDWFGDVDIVVNAAGVNLRQAAEAISADSWNQTLDINLAAPFFLSREFVPQMRDNGWGRIINIASLQSARAFANGLAYGASKGGVAQLTRAMAEAWSGHGVNCNAIAPGFFPTALTEKVFADEALARRCAQQTAIGRNGELRDLDGITLFLASRASDYITGQVIYVDGGFTAK